VAQEAYCQVSLADSDKLEIQDGDWLEVESPQGRLKLKAKITDRLREGTIFIPLNFPETPVNSLMDKNLLVDLVRVSKLVD